MGIPCTCISLYSPNPITALNSDQSLLEKQKELSSFDYKHHSQSVFNVFLQIRLKPKEYSSYIIDLLSKASSQETKDPKETDNEQNAFLSPKTSSFLLSYLINHEDMRSILNELAIRLASIESRSNAMQWDDNLYQGFELSQKNNKDKQYSFLFSRIFSKNLRIVQYIIQGYYEPEIVPWLLILQNKEKTLDILTDDYINCFVYSSNATDSNSNHSQFVTEFFFLYNNPQNVLINGHNPMTGDFQPLHLDEDVFKNIQYKKDIVSGSYIFIGNVLNVNFQLCNGDTKEENLNISKDLL